MICPVIKPSFYVLYELHQVRHYLLRYVWRARILLGVVNYYSFSMTMLQLFNLLLFKWYVKVSHIEIKCCNTFGNSSFGCLVDIGPAMSLMYSNDVDMFQNLRDRLK